MTRRARIPALAAAVADVGYTVPTTEVTLDIRGMTCASCVAHVERALTDLDGVTSTVVNLGLSTARVTAIPGVVTISAMKQAVREVGYEAAERGSDVDALDRERQARVDEIRRQGRNLLIAGTVGLLVMIGTFYDMLGPLQAVVPVWLSYNLTCTPPLTGIASNSSSRTGCRKLARTRCSCASTLLATSYSALRPCKWQRSQC